MRNLILSLLALCMASCAAVDAEKAPLALSPAGFSDLPQWDGDDHAQALAAFLKSCARIEKRPADAAFGPAGGTYGDWRPACAAARSVPPGGAREFFETHFTPYRAAAQGGGADGLFTGYYEPSLRGATRPLAPYLTPLYATPADLVAVDLGDFSDELKGKRIAGRVVDGRLKPYEDRAGIEAPGWAARTGAKPLVWVDDPVDAFFLHIQGSGRVDLADGGVMRVGYDGQNGHAYYAIGRELVKRGIMDKDAVSLQSIRAWLEAHPGEAADLMNLNKSYVFFRELGEDGPQGGEGVTLTPGRSLAVDRTKIPYGAPLWVDIAPPAPGEAPIRRLMVAQDTGGAIKGPVRGDFFWGAGDRAADLAGQMKAQGRYWLLLPKTVKTLVN